MLTDPRRLTKETAVDSDFGSKISLGGVAGGKSGRIDGVWLKLVFDESHRANNGSGDYEFKHSLGRIPQRFIVAGGNANIRKGATPWTLTKVYFQTGEQQGAEVEILLL